MTTQKRSSVHPMLFTVLIWGGLWGVFEATVGYLLHLLPFSVGWMVWYPVACFFMLNVYRATRSAGAVLSVGLLSACIKLMNLFLPIRVDKVLNPALSIVFEALSMAAVILLVKHFLAEKEKTVLLKGIAIFAMNSGWRVLYSLYLLLLAPDWIREVSVISSAESFIRFFVVHNLLTGVILLLGSFVIKPIMRFIQSFESKLSVLLSRFSLRSAAGIKAILAVVLISGGIALELLL